MDTILPTAGASIAANMPSYISWDSLALPWSMSQALQTLATLFVLVQLVTAGYRLWFHPLARYPGHPLHAVLYFPYLYSLLIKGDWTRKISALHFKYGPIVRVGPNHLSLDGSVAWPEIYALRGDAELLKPPGRFCHGDRVTLLNSPRDVHRRQRRQLSHAFSSASLASQEPTISHYVDVLMRQLTSRTEAGQPINIVDWLNFIAFDIIGDLTLSESFGCLNRSDYHAWVLSVFRGIRGNSLRRFFAAYPLLQKLSDALGLATNLQVFTHNQELARSKTTDRIQRGLQATPGRADLMTHMLKPNRDGQHGFLEDEIIVTTPLLITAGSETTATALSGLIFQLTQKQNRDIRRRLADEIRLTFATEDDITMAATANLEYLRACIEEILRFYPPVFEVPARVSLGSTTVAGYLVPAGTHLSVSQLTTLRNPLHWVEPDSFLPERWLPSTHPLYDARFESDNHAVFKPFSFGPRDCLGKNLAYAEMRLILARFLYRFDFELETEMSDWMLRQRNFGLWEKTPLYLKLRIALPAK